MKHSNNWYQSNPKKIVYSIRSSRRPAKIKVWDRYHKYRVVGNTAEDTFLLDIPVTVPPIKPEDQTT